jgi:manganese/zinc/iron transport system substrate-binding protein
MRRIGNYFGILLLLALVLSACAGGDTDRGQGGIRVVATIGMIADVARNIGGEHVDVVQLMGAGVDPHLYAATERDVERLLEAEMILYNGLYLEARMVDILEQLAQDGVTVVAVGEALPESLVIQGFAGGDFPDPHIWMDAGRWTIVAQAITEALIDFDPQSEADYRANAEAYLQELSALDEFVRSSIASVPEAQRRLVTAHDAFNYYSLAYGIDVFAPQGISTESEASVADIQATIDYVVEHQVPAVFFESSIPIDTVEAIVEGTRARGHQVEIGGELYSDAMGPEGTPEGTYLGMIRANTETIVTALGGQVGE